MANGGQIPYRVSYMALSDLDYARHTFAMASFHIDLHSPGGGMRGYGVFQCMHVSVYPASLSLKWDALIMSIRIPGQLCYCESYLTQESTSNP